MSHSLFFVNENHAIVAWLDRVLSRRSDKAPLCKGRFPPIAGENVGKADKRGAASRRARLSAARLTGGL